MFPSPRFRKFVCAATPRRRALAASLLSLILLVSFLAPAPRAAGSTRPSRQETANLAATDNSSSLSLNKSRALAEFVPGEVIVRFRADAKERARELAAETLQVAGRAVEMKIERMEGSEIVEGLRLARVAPAETLAAVEALKARADVLYAEPNYVRRSFRTPNDPRFADQYALRNTGQVGGTIGADIKAETAWETTTGSRSIVVGIVDEGIDTTHPDLQANIWTNAGEVAGNSVDDDGNGFVDDVNGYDFFHNDSSVYDGTAADNTTDAHGTHVAGIVGAEGNNAAGIAGVNWQTSLMSLKILGRDDEASAPSSVLTTVRAYQYAKMMRDLWVSTGGLKGANVRVLNNSYGGYGRSQAELDAINALASSGILFVAAAGNENSSNDATPSYPASYEAPNIISVTVTDRAGQFPLYGLFNYGQRTVHMGAPGWRILSTTPHNTYTEFDGTSMAAPHVAGAAALLLADNPALSLARLRAALLYSGDENTSLSSRTVTGRSLNAASAVQNAKESDTTAPAAVGNFHLTTQQGRTIALEWTAPGDDNNTGRAALYQLRFSDVNPADAAQFEQGRTFLEVPPRPLVAGTVQNTAVRIPFQHPNGFVAIRAIDNAGNAGAISVLPISVEPVVADPYTVTQTAASPLSTGGTPLNLKGDDVFAENYQLPYAIPFFGQTLQNVTVSSNGALYFSMPPSFLNIPRLGDGTSLDALSSVYALNRRGMIAGMWDDLRTDRRATDDVYMIVEPTRVIFRWQAVTYNTPLSNATLRGEQPVNFEIELGRNGTITLRYGAGQSAPVNTQLFPVVGISGGSPDAYLVASHTSEESPISLTNAPTVSFALKNPPQPPTNDMSVSVTDAPDPVFTGQTLTYTVDVRNLTGSEAYNVVMTDQLPAGVTFLSCAAAAGVVCSSNGSGTVTATIGQMGSVSTSRLTINVRVDAAPESILSNTASVTSLFADPNPSNNTASTETRVVNVSLFGGVRQIAAGVKHTLALRTDGTVWAWGDGYAGKLGEAVWAGKITPLQVGGLGDVAAIAAGEDHSLALRTDGTVWAWGSNISDALGVAGGGFRSTPKQVAGLSSITAITAGASFSAALKSDGTVWTWGSNYEGALGRGNVASLSDGTPTPVVGLGGVVAIASGRWHTLALKADGTVWAWGLNLNGSMGLPTSTRAVPTPVQIGGLSNIKAIAAGQTHTVALKTDGTVVALGSGGSGQLGTNSTATSLTPVQPVGMTNAVAIAAGLAHTLVLKADGTLWAFGSNSSGELGQGTSGAGRAFPVQVPNISGIAQIVAKENFNVALLNDGTLRAWGANTNGQLGDDTNLNRSAPVSVSGLCSVSMPSMSPAGGDYSSPIFVRLTTPTEGARIHYTRNGVEPTEADPFVASGEGVLIDGYTTLKAKAFRSGWKPSSASDATFFFISTGNRIDDARTFVQQQYRDFFSREADAPGLSFWTGVIYECAKVADAAQRAACVDNRRTHVSAAFFLSTEFQKTGYLVYRLEKASYARMPRFATFLADTQAIGQGVIVNSPGWEEKLETNTRSFLDAWVNRSDFKARFPDALTAAEYVSRLFEYAEVVPTTEQRSALVNGLSSGTETRATVLRKVAESDALYRQEYNRAFVLMQYFGYLRRNPDDAPEATRDFAGYNFWLTKLNNHGGDFVSAEMVRSFLISGEYRQRFLQ